MHPAKWKFVQKEFEIKNYMEKDGVDERTWVRPCWGVFGTGGTGSGEHLIQNFTIGVKLRCII